MPEVLISVDNEPPNAPVAETTLPITFTSSKPAAHVHFRSRVRIASGLHSGHNHHDRHRRHEGAIPRPEHSHQRSTTDDLTTSTTTSSPSSSISAPLRYQPDESNVLGPLGKRLNALAQSRRRRLAGIDDTQSVYGFVGYNGSTWDMGEGTPFLRAAVGPGGATIPDYTRRRSSRYIRGRRDREVEAVRDVKREEDIIFGEWPWRVFNRRWWWYQLQPVLCCSDDFDD